MKVKINNLLTTPLSTSYGLIDASSSITVNMSPQDMYKGAEDILALETAGRVSVVIDHESSRSDKMETAGLPSGAVFMSAEITGNGSAQNTAHGLGIVPSKVAAYLTGGPAAYAQPTITLGAHDATNCVVTCTANWKYRIVAWK